MHEEVSTYFDTAVYGSHFWILRHDFSIIDVVDFKHLNEGIVIDEIIQFLRAD